MIFCFWRIDRASKYKKNGTFWLCQKSPLFLYNILFIRRGICKGQTRRNSRPGLKHTCMFVCKYAFFAQRTNAITSLHCWRYECCPGVTFDHNSGTTSKEVFHTNIFIFIPTLHYCLVMANTANYSYCEQFSLISNYKLLYLAHVWSRRTQTLLFPLSIYRALHMQHIWFKWQKRDHNPYDHVYIFVNR